MIIYAFQLGMSRVRVATVILLCLFLEFTCIETKCNKFWKDKISEIITKRNAEQIYGNISSNVQIVDGDILHLRCLNGSVVNGGDVLICQNNTWNPKQPNCTLQRSTTPKDPLPWTTIGISIGGGVTFIIVVTITIICVLRRRRKKNKDTEPLPNVPFRHGNLSSDIVTKDRDSDHYVDVFYSQVNKDRKRADTQSRDDSGRGYMDIYRHSDGISLVGSTESILGVSSIPIYKVWTCRRTRRKFIRAENIEQLKRKAAAIYQYDNPVRITLEEDGTEVDGDDVLTSCSDKTLIVLSGNEHWVDSSGNPNKRHIQKYTFDVCSQDRKVRKLILAENIKDLVHQAIPCVGYSVEYICLEEDGTFIEDDDTLLMMSGKTLMLLGKDHHWRPTKQPIPSIEHSDKQSYLKESAFKVWSADYTKKKIIKADNCIDLHLKAAKMLDLEMPLQIRVKDENTIISSDKVLATNKDNILIAAPTNAPRWIGESNDTSENKNFIDDNGSKANRQIEPDRKVTPRYENGQNRFQRYPNGMTNNIPPDVVISTEAAMVQMPPRYEPSSQLPQNVPKNVPKMNAREDDYNIREFVRADNVDLSPQESHNKASTPHFGRKDNDINGFKYDRRLTSKENNFASPNPTPKNANASQDNVYSVVQSNRNSNPSNWNNAQKSESDNPLPLQKFNQQKGKFGQHSQIQSELGGKNVTSLPYANLEPLHKTKQIVEKYPPKREFANQTNSTTDYGLPYSDLEPSHRKGKPKNNFEMMRQEQTRQTPVMHENEFQERESSIRRQPSFLVTGGAKQSNHSDVLF